MDFTDIYRTLHPNATEYTFFSSARGAFSRRDHKLGHTSGLNRYQKIGIVPCIFSDHNAFKLELNHKKKFGRISSTWRLRTILLKDGRVNQEIKKVEPIWMLTESRLKILEGMTGNIDVISSPQGGEESDPGYTGLEGACGGWGKCGRRKQEGGWR